MAKNSKSKPSKVKKKINPRLAAMFKMTREELALRKMTGGGIHRTHPRDIPRSEQKRKAIDEETNLDV
ncbi:MAG: hypothetical protein JWN75_398 [Candidatus Saccharibacteria bacterium]|nr:hypothetical protein [Candidatus Saccharibacteria bacterium]